MLIFSHLMLSIKFPISIGGGSSQIILLSKQIYLFTKKMKAVNRSSPPFKNRRLQKCAKWRRGESNPCPKSYSPYFYMFILLTNNFHQLCDRTGTCHSLSILIIHPQGQRFPSEVSHINEASIQRCECQWSD